jgi:hypothetical protein
MYGQRPVVMGLQQFASPEDMGGVVSGGGGPPITMPTIDQIRQGWGSRRPLAAATDAGGHMAPQAANAAAGGGGAF